MNIKKIKLYTNIEKSGELQPKDEVEQRLTIMSNGKVILTSTTYGKGYNHYGKGRKEEIKIDKPVVDEIFHFLDEKLVDIPKYNVLPQYGLWTLFIQYNNKTAEYYGSLSGENNELTEYIERRLPLKDVVLFGK